MKRTVRAAAVAAVAGVLLAAGVGAAQASVTYDPTTGTGFVGKGDIQTAFGWNNEQAQQGATGVTFNRMVTKVYVGTCTWLSNAGTSDQRTTSFPRITNTFLNSTVVSDPRLHKQYTGYNLTGIGSTITRGEVPEIGAPCTGWAGAVGTYTAVDLLATMGGLYATNADGYSYLIVDESTL